MIEATKVINFIIFNNKIIGDIPLAGADGTADQSFHFIIFNNKMKHGQHEYGQSVIIFLLLTGAGMSSCSFEKNMKDESCRLKKIIKLIFLFGG